MKEGILRKKLKNSCTRPKRSIVNFLNDEKDMSLHTFLKRTEESSRAVCREESCGKPLI